MEEGEKGGLRKEKEEGRGKWGRMKKESEAGGGKRERKKKVMAEPGLELGTLGFKT